MGILQRVAALGLQVEGGAAWTKINDARSRRGQTLHGKHECSVLAPRFPLVEVDAARDQVPGLVHHCSIASSAPVGPLRSSSLPPDDTGSSDSQLAMLRIQLHLKSSKIILVDYITKLQLYESYSWPFNTVD